MALQSSIEIVPLLPEHRQSVINIIMGSFFLQEPLNAALKFDIPHEPLTWVDHIIDTALRDQCSFVAIDTTTPYKDIVGVILNGIINRLEPEESLVTPIRKIKFYFFINGYCF